MSCCYIQAPSKERVRSEGEEERREEKFAQSKWPLRYVIHLLCNCPCIIRSSEFSCQGLINTFETQGSGLRGGGL